MFSGLQGNRCLVKSLNVFFAIGALHGSQVSKLQFVRGNVAMSATDGAAAASTKTLKLENASDLLRSEDVD